VSDNVRIRSFIAAILGITCALGCTERRSAIGVRASVMRDDPFGASLSSIDPLGAHSRTALLLGSTIGDFPTIADISGSAASFGDSATDSGIVQVPGAGDTHGACPTGMVLVEGESCTEVEHTCLREMKDDPAHRCLEYKPGADQCIASRGKLKFCMDRYEWPGTPGAQPRVLVDYYEAERSCKSVGKRICKEDEFYLACEGPEHWPYAWGHVRHPSPCNIDRPYFMVDWLKWAKGGEPMVEEARRLDQALPIGSSKCWSPYGVHDIAGNVDEWTRSRPGRELEGSLNGGYWGPVQNACRYVTLVHGPEFLFYQIGFRCCSEAK
jgi:sulfatase modifying factor 1